MPNNEHLKEGRERRVPWAERLADEAPGAVLFGNFPDRVPRAVRTVSPEADVPASVLRPAASAVEQRTDVDQVGNVLQMRRPDQILNPFAPVVDAWAQFAVAGANNFAAGAELWRNLFGTQNGSSKVRTRSARKRP